MAKQYPSHRNSADMETSVRRKFLFDPTKWEYRLGGILLDHPTGYLKELGFIYDGNHQRRDGLDAFQVGKFAHRGLELYAHGKLDLNTVDNRLRGYIESGIRWFDKNVTEVLGVEERLYNSTYMIAWTLDLRCRTKMSSRIAIPDYTIAANAPWKRFQTSHYSLLAETTDVDRGCVHLKEDGSLANWVPHNNPNDAQMALSFLNTARELRANNIRLQRRRDDH